MENINTDSHLSITGKLIIPVVRLFLLLILNMFETTYSLNHLIEVVQTTSSY